MAFNYDEEDDFDEIDNVDEMDDYDEEDNLDDAPEEDFLEEENEPNTALSRAFREATASEEIDDEDDDDDEDDEEYFDEEDERADEQRLVEPVDTLPDDGDDEDSDDTEDSDDEEDSDTEDEDDLEVELPTLELPLPKPEVEQFRPREQNNNAYADAVTAYYEEKNYQRAIEKFDEAIANEEQRTENNTTDPNAILAKSKYWQAEAYVKLQDISEAIRTFQDLVKTCEGHYLVLAAQRRADQLNTENA